MLTLSCRCRARAWERAGSEEAPRPDPPQRSDLQNTSFHQSPSQFSIWTTDYQLNYKASHRFEKKNI
jgi:hypothetical protein